MQASRASKNLIYSKGKSSGIMPIIKSGVNKVKDWYNTQHQEKQKKLNEQGTESIFM